MDRLKPLIVALGLAVCLIAAAPPGLPGDGGEYFALSLNFAHLRGPAISHRYMPGYMQELGAAQPGLENFDPSPFMRRAKDGRLDFLHFWFYSFLATPGIWLMWLVGAPPVYAFSILNIGLLLLALRLALPRIGGAACVLLFASPIIWWINKAHTEPYTFALIAIALLLFRERPWWALVAAGAATLQNPVAGVLLALLLLASATSGRRFFRDRRWLAGALAGILLASVHVFYFWLRYRTPSLLIDTTRQGTPALAEIVVPVFDPAVGLLANFPALAIVGVAALIVVLRRRPRELLSTDMLVSVAAALLFLVGFARNTNYHHGGTPSVSRYALWLIPLAIPLLRAARAAESVAWIRGLWAVSIASAVVTVFVFHPAVPDNGRVPTLAAKYMWTKHPTWYNSLPQVFAETILHTEGIQVPVETPGCEKILIGSSQKEGTWPIPCYPEPVPERCVGRYCYANLVDRHYVFVRAPGRDHGPGPLMSDAAWPAEAESHIRDLYDKWAWWTMSINGDSGVLRQGHNVRISTLSGKGSAIFVLRSIGPDASLFFRPPGPMTGILIDPRTGVVLTQLNYTGAPFEPWTIDLPGNRDLLVLAVRYQQ